MQSLWMLLAAAMFALMGACVKVATDWGADLAHIIIFRGTPSILVILVWAMATRRRLRPRSWRFHLWRNISGTGSMWLGFYAITQLPLALAMSLQYTAPLFIAGWMLGWGGAQRDGMRVFTVILGFLGVLVILRPGMGQEHWLAVLAGVGAGGMAAISMMQLRQLGRVGEPEWRTVFIFSSCIVISGIVMLLVQDAAPLNSRVMLPLVGLGIFGLVGQLAMTRAFGMGSTLLSAALQYATIIFAALLGFLVWGSVPDMLAWAGMALIIASGLLSTWRTYSEDRLLQGGAAPAPAGTDIQIAAAPPVAGVDVNPELSKEAQHA